MKNCLAGESFGGTNQQELADITTYFTYQTAGTYKDLMTSPVNFIPGISGSVRFHEDINHAGTTELRNIKLALNRFYAERVSRFLQRLNVVEDPGTGMTYLDHSLVMWGNDQGATKNTNAHRSVNMPVLLAGSAGGFLKTGRYIDYGPSYGSLLRPVGGDESAYKKGGPITSC